MTIGDLLDEASKYPRTMTVVARIYHAGPAMYDDVTEVRLVELTDSDDSNVDEVCFAIITPEPAEPAEETVALAQKEEQPNG